ncbi:MAG: hypothetical protein NTX22_02130 [Ignavibacteriales bacterium]|nr:hypothetical protein [Ignavibacteriales bacterium]
MNSFIKLLSAIIVMSNLILAQELSLKLLFDKKTFLRYEQVEFLMELRNTGNEECLIEGNILGREDTRIDIIVLDENGKILLPTLNAGGHSLSTNTFFKLPSGESIYEKINLSSWYGNEKFGKIVINRFEPYSFLQGKYSVKIKYNYMYLDLNKSLQRKEFCSDIVTFSVVKPKNSQDITVLNKLNELRKKDELIYKYEEEVKNLRKEYINIIDEFPNTNYFLSVYNNLIDAYHIEKFNDIPEKILWNLLKRFPNAPLTYYAVSCYKTYYKNFYHSEKFQSKISKFVKKVIDKNEVIKKK